MLSTTDQHISQGTLMLGVHGQYAQLFREAQLLAFAPYIPEILSGVLRGPDEE
jgi:hypothetical protein